MWIGNFPKEVTEIKIPGGRFPVPAVLYPIVLLHFHFQQHPGGTSHFPGTPARKDSPISQIFPARKDSLAASLLAQSCKRQTLLMPTEENRNTSFQPHALGQRNRYYLPLHASTGRIRPSWSSLSHGCACLDSCRQPSKENDTKIYIKAYWKRYLKCLSLQSQCLYITKLPNIRVFPCAWKKK